MSTLLRRDPRTMFPDLVEWFEEPFLTLRPYLGQPIRIEDFIEDDHYMIRAERRSIVRGLIYPVPDPEFPFLGVHFTRTIHGDVEDCRRGLGRRCLDAHFSHEQKISGSNGSAVDNSCDAFA